MAATARRRTIPAPRILSGLERAMLASMIDDLPHGCDLGDERAIIHALVGKYAPRDIMSLLDLVTEQARRLRQHEINADPIAAALYVAALAPAIALVAFWPGTAHAASLANADPAPALWPLYFIGTLAALSIAWLIFGPAPRPAPDDEPDDEDEQPVRYRDLAQ
jgi:hypothetical protein